MKPKSFLQIRNEMIGPLFKRMKEADKDRIAKYLQMMENKRSEDEQNKRLQKMANDRWLESVSDKASGALIEAPGPQDLIPTAFFLRGAEIARSSGTVLSGAAKSGYKSAIDLINEARYGKNAVNITNTERAIAKLRKVASTTPDEDEMMFIAKTGTGQRNARISSSGPFQAHGTIEDNGTDILHDPSYTPGTGGFIQNGNGDLAAAWFNGHGMSSPFDPTNISAISARIRKAVDDLVSLEKPPQDLRAVFMRTTEDNLHGDIGPNGEIMVNRPFSTSTGQPLPYNRLPGGGVSKYDKQEPIAFMLDSPKSAGHMSTPGDVLDVTSGNYFAAGQREFILPSKDASGDRFLWSRINDGNPRSGMKIFSNSPVEYDNGIKFPEASSANPQIVPNQISPGYGPKLIREGSEFFGGKDVEKYKLLDFLGFNTMGSKNHIVFDLDDSRLDKWAKQMNIKLRNTTGMGTGVHPSGSMSKSENLGTAYEFGDQLFKDFGLANRVDASIGGATVHVLDQMPKSWLFEPEQKKLLDFIAQWTDGLHNSIGKDISSIRVAPKSSYLNMGIDDWIRFPFAQHGEGSPNTFMNVLDYYTDVYRGGKEFITDKNAGYLLSSLADLKPAVRNAVIKNYKLGLAGATATGGGILDRYFKQQEMEQ